ncbi:MAG: hypothetical protein ACRDX8_04890 [Acidimicrobiales bacterium]
MPTLIAAVASAGNAGDNIAWWIAIGVGAAVVLVVIVLLSLLTAFVKDVDERVEDALDTAGRVAVNTSGTSELVETLNLTNDLKVETQKHADLLTR